MNYNKRSGFFFGLMILLILLSVTSPLSLISYVSGASDKGEERSNDKGNNGNDKGNNGKGHDKDGDDGGSDDGDDGGSDDGDDGASDDGDDGASDDGDDGDDGASDDGDDGDDGASDDGDGGDDGASDDGDGGDGDGDGITNKNIGLNENGTEHFVSQTGNQTVEDNYIGKAFYVLIKSVNNKTNFVPDKVTLPVGSTIIWLNYDNSEHRITVGSGSKSDYALLNSLILPNGMVDQEFQSAGTYHYSDLDNPQSKGVITILDNAEKDGAISIPLED